MILNTLVSLLAVSSFLIGLNCGVSIGIKMGKKAEYDAWVLSRKMLAEKRGLK